MVYHFKVAKYQLLYTKWPCVYGNDITLEIIKPWGSEFQPVYVVQFCYFVDCPQIVSILLLIDTKLFQISRFVEEKKLLSLD